MVAMHHEAAIRRLLGVVKAGALSRRAFVRAMLAAGVTAPLAGQMLGAAGIARAQSGPAATPTKRGGGGRLKVVWWQGPAVLNPHLAAGTKDQDGSRIFYEPLASFDPEGNLQPVLAQEVPTLANGGVGRDGRSVIWRLKRGVAWHDGKPFTADDVVFNWEYAADPATGATTLGAYADIARVEKIDSHAVKVVFKKPTPFWSDAFCGTRLLIPRHIFAGYRGARARDAVANLKPVGTGPYRFVEFKPGELVRAEVNPGYHVPNRPFFDVLELKGGGDPVSAALAVAETGDSDFAWNTQAEDEVLRRVEKGGKGKLLLTLAGNIEHIQCNQADPWSEVDGERSSVKTPHPLLAHPEVRSALNLLVDRAAIHDQIYGRLGRTSANFLNAPSRFSSRNTRWEFDVNKANAVLEAAGWRRGADGIRVRGGRRLKLVLQTAASGARQKAQALVKQAGGRAGIDVELKVLPPAAFFSPAAASADSYTRFNADLQMYTLGLTSPDPQAFMRQFASWEVAAKGNGWQGPNITRWRNPEYDRAWRAAESEIDPIKRAALFIHMNDLVIQNVVVIPLLWRPGVAVASATLKGTDLSGWDSSLWNLANWSRQT